MADPQYIIIDNPRDKVRRITLNRPDARNALSNALRGEIFVALEEADRDPSVHVTIIRGAGPSFCAGYDLKSDTTKDQPFHTAEGLGNWARHVVDGSFKVWDLAKPVIAQVHGYCLAGGMELAQSCDLIYVAEDAKIGYPVVRSMSPPDNQFFPWVMGMRKAMEMMLTGDSLTGTQAAEAGFANTAFPGDVLEDKVLAMATRVAKIPPDLQAFNKRSVHRQMEMMGIRQAVRATTDLQQLAFFTRSARDTFKTMAEGPLTKALDKRDEKFEDYRTTDRD